MIVEGIVTTRRALFTDMPPHISFIFRKNCKEPRATRTVKDFITACDRLAICGAIGGDDGSPLTKLTWGADEAVVVGECVFVLAEGAGFACNISSNSRGKSRVTQTGTKVGAIDMKSIGVYWAV